MTIEKTKVCTDPACDHAGQPQPISAFPPNGRGGTKARCRICNRLYERLYKARRRFHAGQRSRSKVNRVTESDLVNARFEFVGTLEEVGLPVLRRKDVPNLRPGEVCWVLR